MAEHNLDALPSWGFEEKLVSAIQQNTYAQVCTSTAMEHRAMAAQSNVVGANGQKQHVCMICQQPWPCKAYAKAMRWLIEQVDDMPLRHTEPQEAPGNSS